MTTNSGTPVVLRGILGVLVLLLLGVPWAGRSLAQSVTRSPAALTNEEVVKLVRLDLGDSVVIAKINQAEAVAFKLDTDDLIKLKEQGVPKDVIAAMLKRSSSPRQASQVASAPSADAQATTASRVGSDIRLLTDAGETLLRATVGDINVVGFSFVKFAYYEIPGTSSRARTSDRSPRIAISADFPPEGYFFVLLLDVDRKNNNRSMKMGSAKQGNFRSRGRGKPDLDNAISCKVERVSENEWRLVPKSPLNPGEYGVWAAARSQGAEGLYDFGVD